MMDTIEIFFHKPDPAVCEHCDKRIFTERAQLPRLAPAPV